MNWKNDKKDEKDIIHIDDFDIGFSHVRTGGRLEP
jgi:hypothetical protein